MDVAWAQLRTVSPLRPVVCPRRAWTAHRNVDIGSVKAPREHALNSIVDDTGDVLIPTPWRARCGHEPGLDEELGRAGAVRARLRADAMGREVEEDDSEQHDPHGR